MQHKLRPISKYFETRHLNSSRKHKRVVKGREDKKEERRSRREVKSKVMVIFLQEDYIALDYFGRGLQDNK